MLLERTGLVVVDVGGAVWAVVAVDVLAWEMLALFNYGDIASFEPSRARSNSESAVTTSSLHESHVLPESPL